MLGGAVLLSGLLAALVSFFLAYSEAKEFQDDMLRQIALFKPLDAPGSSAASTSDVEASGVDDPETRILILHLPGDARPAWLPDELPAGFHTLYAGDIHLRVFVHDISPGGRRTVVAQATDARDEIAINSALHTLIPLLLLPPLLTWLVVRIVRRELAPIARLSRRLDAQPADRPEALADAGLPDEISPFIHAINRLLERVNQLMAQQRRFIADAAHELRSPLTALSLQAQNLTQAATLEAARERVIPLQEGIERARQLTEQLLSLARMQAGSGGETEVDVSAMARELIAENLPYAEAKGIDLGLDERAPLRVRAAPDTLRLILKNGLENALKYTAQGGEVTLRLWSDVEGAVIEVVDNGPGIPDAERERVFDAFYRLPSSDGEGSGLGLAIAREAASRLGGAVSLHAPPDGCGLVFRCRFVKHDPNNNPSQT
jgi:two-component system OmpR family sensor kinase